MNTRIELFSFQCGECLYTDTSVSRVLHHLSHAHFQKFKPYCGNCKTPNVIQINYIAGCVNNMCEDPSTHIAFDLKDADVMKESPDQKTVLTEVDQGELWQPSPVPREGGDSPGPLVIVEEGITSPQPSPPPPTELSTPSHQSGSVPKATTIPFNLFEIQATNLPTTVRGVSEPDWAERSENTLPEEPMDLTSTATRQRQTASAQTFESRPKAIFDILPKVENWVSQFAYPTCSKKEEGKRAARERLALRKMKQCLKCGQLFANQKTLAKHRVQFHPSAETLSRKLEVYPFKLGYPYQNIM